MNNNLMWAITIISIVAMICGTLLWINYNSWTFRFEMDDNTKEVITNIDLEKIQPKKCERLNNYTFACPPGYSKIKLNENEINKIVEWAEWQPHK